ncbi:hypothetical protein JCGZ_20638 [Jatropha curcas]|uniref:CASP-like protein n=1 Tax=Jatropha curcas TaxID=180498 RepID=A0A067JNM2_JATCU|nr:hypothetical protein JCGZ_20638 [Jatropha curcas]
MKQGEELVFAGRTMVGVSESPLSVNSLSQRPFPTPSPFSFSIASTRWSSRPSIHLSGLVLRFLALLFSFVSALSLAFPPSKKNGQFADYPELKYCFVVYVLVFIYSAFQLFKGVCDITHTGFLISDMISDYLSFILDQVAASSAVSDVIDPTPSDV